MSDPDPCGTGVSPSTVPTRRTWTHAEIIALGAQTDVQTAASILGIGRTTAYELIRRDEFPIPVVRAGTRIVVPVYGLLRALGLVPQNGSLDG